MTHPNVIRPQYPLDRNETGGLVFLGRHFSQDLYIDSFDGEVRAQCGPGHWEHACMKLDEILAQRYRGEDNDSYLEALDRARAAGIIAPKAAVNMDEVWEKDDRGDALTDDELDAAVAQIHAALPYLHARGRDYRLITADTGMKVSKLIDFRNERQRRANAR